MNLLFPYCDNHKGLESHPHCMKHFNGTYFQLLEKNPLMRACLTISTICSWYLSLRNSHMRQALTFEVEIGAIKMSQAS